MQILEHNVYWSPTDLTRAALCEYAFARQVDVQLGRSEATPRVESALLQRLARLGDAHEADILAELEATFGVVRLERPATTSYEHLVRLQRETITALTSIPEVVYQAGFFDGEFLGYADFLLASHDGWIVADAKLAQEARPTALLQVAAYADQLLQAGVDVAPVVALLLGNGRREEFPLAELLPIYHERRKRLRALIASRTDPHALPVTWGDDSLTACGSCDECEAAADAHDDIILVAGMRTDQRRKLRTAGIATIGHLANCSSVPAAMSPTTFVKLQRQAALQHLQREAERSHDPHHPSGAHVRFELLETAPEAFAQLPAPSPGDLFFDFEGDPLYVEADLERWGLEYLWGTMAAPTASGTSGDYIPLWAHDSTNERAALMMFLDWIVERRAAYPDMHVYHYAPYETTALKRLVSIYQTHEDELDELLRNGVFVDLYAIVRGTIRVSQPSYSIKKLEPLYMGAELRDSAVQSGDESIVEYHEYRELKNTGQMAQAQVRLEALEDYNRYDCLSTLRLRDWLVEQESTLDLPGVGGAPELLSGTNSVPQSEPANSSDVERSDPQDAGIAMEHKLMALAGGGDRITRDSDEQAYAMLAASLGYFRREQRPFWWAHFDRMARPVEEWAADRDIFRVAAGTVLTDWALHSPRARNPRRQVELQGDWGAGSTPGTSACLVFDQPVPPGVQVPVHGLYGYHLGQPVAGSMGATHDTVRYEESRKPDETYASLPIALVPDAPPRTAEIEAAIKSMAELAVNTFRDATAGRSADHELPEGPAFDLLRRIPPRLRNSSGLPRTGNTVDDIVETLIAMDDSYLAVQGPPGTGKTWTGSRVIRRLVEDHGWRVGVVAQSHAVVEHMLDAIIDAGLAPELVGKSNPRSSNVKWTAVTDSSDHRAGFALGHMDTGCVLGGTAWTFASAKLLAAGELDLLVVDEAGQFALAPIVGITRIAHRLLLLGDPQQLPQVSQGTHPEPVDRSALAWLLGEDDTLPSTHGYFLADTYRMHPTVCAAVSRLSYGGRLRSAAVTSQRLLAGVPAGVFAVEVDHQDNRTESPEEAVAVVAIVEKLLGSTWSHPGDPDPARAERSLDQADFLVVAPFNAQVNLIRRTLVAAGYEHVRVGTVDKFQGQEAPVCIVSMTASSHRDVPRGMRFLLNRNRVNVAISRAIWRAVILRSPALTQYMPNTVPELLELGSFIRLCAVPG